MNGEQFEPGVERTDRWRGVGAATVLAATLGLLTRQPPLLLVSGVGVALLAFGLGHGLTFPTLASAIAGLTDSKYRAGVMSIRTSMLMAGQAVGPWLFPRLGGVTGYASLLVGAGLLAVVTGVVALSVIRSRHGLAPSPA